MSKFGHNPLYTPALSGPSMDEVAAAQKIVDAHRDAIEEQKRGTLIECQKCEAKHPVSSLVYIQTHYYVSPHGCTGGDYWRQSEGQYHCPCGHLNRLLYMKEAAQLKRYFASVEDRYDR